MATFQECYSYMIMDEDPQQLHACVPDLPGQWVVNNGVKSWDGAHAISGVNSATWPLQFAHLLSIPQAERGPAVEDFYKTNFWNNWYAQLTNVPLAQRVFDGAVNEGSGTIVRVLQKALNALGQMVSVDGDWGPSTVRAANSCDNTSALCEYRHQRKLAYLDIDTKRIAHGLPPTDPKIMAQWLARAAK